MNDAAGQFRDQYRAALADYLTGGQETALARAYDLGRQALILGLGLLEVAAIHHELLREVLQRVLTPQGREQTVKMAEHFFVESLSPFEMAYRGFREGNTALRRLNEMLEEQAKHIARALHDEAGQLLASAHIALAELVHRLPPQTREHLQTIKSLLDMIEEGLRDLSHELRPTILDDLGLGPALDFLAQRVARRTGLAIRIENTVNGRLPPPVETALYRIHQEALTNVTKHAKAARVSVRLTREGQGIRCCIRDDGIGFDVRSVSGRRGERGLGLIGIRERLEALGGALQIISEPGQGTELVITIPLET